MYAAAGQLFVRLNVIIFLKTIRHASIKRIKLPSLQWDGLWLTIFIYKTNNFSAINKSWVKRNWFQLFYKAFFKTSTFFIVL